MEDIDNERGRLLVNKMMTPDGTILESHYRHEAVYHTDKNGKKYMTDGGTDYIHRIANGDEIDLSVYSYDPHNIIREHFSWGTYGKSGKEKFKRILLKDLTTEHIEAILETQNLHEVNRILFENELGFRSSAETGVDIRATKYKYIKDEEVKVEPVKKTSYEWVQESSVEVKDPDGWDRQNFEYSWYEEKITREEFDARVCRSTVRYFNFRDN